MERVCARLYAREAEGEGEVGGCSAALENADKLFASESLFIIIIIIFMLFILFSQERNSFRALICSYCAKSVKLKLQILRLEFILHGRIIILSGGLRKLLHLDNCNDFCEFRENLFHGLFNIFQYWICIIF